MSKIKLTLEDVKKAFYDDLYTHQLQRKKEIYNIKQEPLKDDKITTNDTFLVGDARIDKIGFVHHHQSSFNNFVEIGINQIITKVFRLNRDFTTVQDKNNTERINIQVEFTDVRIDKPTFDTGTGDNPQIITPNLALTNNNTYSATLHIDAKVTATAYMKDGSTKVRSAKINKKKICQIPVMIKSNICNLNKLSDSALIGLHEDPSDMGGHFIIKGVEWVIDTVENIPFNQPRVYKNRWQKESVRCEFLSKPGDSYQNSAYLIIRLLNNGQLTIEIMRDKLKEKTIPFYLLFKALGWNRDKDIIDNIVYGYDSKLSRYMLTKLKMAFSVKYDKFNKGRGLNDPTEAMKYIVSYLVDEDDRPLKYLSPLSKQENMHQAIKIVSESIDEHLLPHIGKDVGSRHEKLRFLSLLIRKIFLVEREILDSTDRDSLKNKRFSASGQSYAKTFKTFFNVSIAQDIISKYKIEFKNQAFEKVNLHSAIDSRGPEFDRAITASISSGTKTDLPAGKNRTVTNRLSSQQHHLKNKLNGLSIKRQITSSSSKDSSKSSDRATEMRRVHPTYHGYICPVHSPEGEKVGINKQLAIFASVCEAGNSEAIKQHLINSAVNLTGQLKDGKTKNEVLLKANEDAFFLLDEINHNDIYRLNLNNVYVNGHLIGFTKSAISLADKYRKLRRGPNIKLDPMVTIHWDEKQDELLIWTDPGRLTRPLIIVYNNLRNPEIFPKNTTGFCQSTLLTPEIIKKMRQKAVTIDDLVDAGVVEYISAEEQENILLCPEIGKLILNRNNEEMQYTHCDIPQAMFGITALTSPFANHNQTPRVTFQTSQAKQTCGYYSLNWPYRVDKDTFLQNVCETPIVSTVANKYIFPNGQNCVVAIAIHGG